MESTTLQVTSTSQKPLISQHTMRSPSNINNGNMGGSFALAASGKRSLTIQNSPDQQQQRIGTTFTNSPSVIMPNGNGGGDSLNRSQIDGFQLHNRHHHGEEEREGHANYLKMKQELDDTVKDLDVKLNRVLAKQEYEYLKGYNVYVKQKERELKDTINQLSERYNNQGAKDKKLQTLQKAIKNIREDQIRMDQDNVGLRNKIKSLQTQNQEITSERDFFQTKAKDVKKKNQLLKLAILRLQNEIEVIKQQHETKKQEEYEQEKSHFFLTELGIAAQKRQSPKATLVTSPTGATGFLLTNDQQSKTLETSQSLIEEPGTVRKDLNITLQDVSTQQYSLLEPSIVSLNQNTSRKGVNLMTSTSALKTGAKTTLSHKRVKSISTISRYASIPTENIKFNTFVDALFASKMTSDDIKDELKGYVTVLETNYNETIRDLKAQVERLSKKLRHARSEKANVQIEKTEFEALFVECIEDVRKEIMKRRLKNEIQTKKKAVETTTNSKKLKKDEGDDDPASKEFEESLMKLASHAKGRIKYEDFTSKDKFNILDLFVNNEKTLIKIYEALFPHRATNSNGPAAHKNLLGSVSNVTSTSTMDKTIGRYGYHSGVAMPSPAVSQSQLAGEPQLHLQFSTPGNKLLHTQASPSPSLMSPSVINKKPYGSSLYGGKHNQQFAAARDTSGSKFNQDSGFILPTITHLSGAQSSLR